MVNFVYGLNLSCFQVYYETYVIGFISRYIVIICMLSYMDSSGGCRNYVPMMRGIGITLERQLYIKSVVYVHNFKISFFYHLKKI